jgi:hypothetical protein
LWAQYSPSSPIRRVAWASTRPTKTNNVGHAMATPTSSGSDDAAFEEDYDPRVPPIMRAIAHTTMCMLTGSDLASGQRWRRGLAVRCKPHGVIRRTSLPAYVLAPTTKRKPQCRRRNAAHRALLAPPRKVGYPVGSVNSESWVRMSRRRLTAALGALGLDQ